MTLEKRLSKLFALDDETWMRHANPRSVYSRTLALPLIALAVWSRVWFGWYCLIPLAAALLFTWLNPRLFGKPSSTKNWASKAVFGERIWMSRDEVSIPAHHSILPKILNGVTSAGLLVMIWGLWELHVWATLSGLILQIIAKYWFLDRMVWLYEDMKETREFRQWLY